MGRTKRKRKRQNCIEYNDMCKVINLQKELKLKCPNIKINYFNDTGWGMRCKKKIEQGEDLIALPLHHLITVDVDCEIFSTLKFDNQTPQFTLSMFLTYESHLNQKSKFFQYIKSLPESFTNPYFCTDREIKLLPEVIRRKVTAQISLIENTIDQLFQIIDGKSCPHCGETLKTVFTREKFIWAWFIVNTRSVYYQVCSGNNDEKHTNSLALAPFLDLFNHSNDAVIKLIIDFENRLYILKTFTSYKKFDQVFIKYGGHSNLKLFLEYGFVLGDNSNDYIEFSFQEVIESVKEFDFNSGEVTKLKYKFIKSNKLNENLTKGQEFSWNFLGLIYVLITKDQDISVLQSKTYSSDFSSTEKNIIQKICEIVSEKKLKELKQSLAKIENVESPTEGLKVAKNLIKNYLKMLKF